MWVQVLPASVDLIHTVAVGDLTADIGLAGSDIDDVGIGGRDGYGADGADGNALVADGIPRAAGVLSLPQASAHRAHVERVGLAGVAGDGEGAATAHGADVAPAKTREERGGELAGGGGLLRQRDPPGEAGQAERSE